VSSGGRFWITFRGLGPIVELERDPGAPAFATEGYTAPTVREKGCVQDSLLLPYALAGFSGSVTVMFVVGTDGQPGRYRVVTDRVPLGIVEPMWKAIVGCEWIPGRDPDGNPAPIYVILPFRFTVSRE